ncbi:hypothetical protein [Endozoicomonas euniceicola]|uniref:Uncharacterized protein n=1 Tax=Endozoicomonas euniceicola TaxID=1234143 RepID=A0ABY6GRU3_9GAMM|nr:hypothetical protein [Endozoicomonas euniceicola]UYM15473.1 hypothetical protein NX720_21895 [Endozoicomonas euniceicola]
MLCFLNSDDLASSIINARQRIVYIAAGMIPTVSAALIKLYKTHPDIDIYIALDINPHSLRLGYGELDCVEELRDAGIVVYEQPNTRLNICVVDDIGWSFSHPPMLVEDANVVHGFNALTLSAEQVHDIAATVANHVQTPQPAHIEGAKTEKPLVGKAVSLLNVQPLTNSRMSEVKEDMARNPAQKFDVSRQVNVFNSRIEFVELELEGAHIDRHTFRFPKEIKQLISTDRDAQDRFNATYKLISEGSKASSKPIVREVDLLRKNFLKPMGKMGRVMLRAQKENFNGQLKEAQKLIADYKTKLQKNLEKELENSKKVLINALVDRVKANPPDELKYGIEGKRVTKKDAKGYLEDLLEKSMPTAESLTGDIKLHCHFKAVTYETLSDEEFQKQLKSAFPRVDWDKPMEEYKAAKESGTQALFDQQKIQY